jgi:hypothetical protein
VSLKNLLSFLSAVNSDGKSSITNVAVMTTLTVVSFEPSPYSVIAFALALANYNAKRFGAYIFTKKESLYASRIERVEQELKAVISMNEMRKISR